MEMVAAGTARRADSNEGWGFGDDLDDSATDGSGSQQHQQEPSRPTIGAAETTTAEGWDNDDFESWDADADENANADAVPDADAGGDVEEGARITLPKVKFTPSKRDE